MSIEGVGTVIHEQCIHNVIFNTRLLVISKLRVIVLYRLSDWQSETADY